MFQLVPKGSGFGCVGVQEKGALIRGAPENPEPLEPPWNLFGTSWNPLEPMI
jgi:hypothetical protein